MPKPVNKLTRWPADWIPVLEQIAAREQRSVSETIRELTLRGMPAKDRKGLSPNPSQGDGGGRPTP